MSPATYQVNMQVLALLAQSALDSHEWGLARLCATQQPSEDQTTLDNWPPDTTILAALFKRGFFLITISGEAIVGEQSPLHSMTAIKTCNGTKRVFEA